MKTCHGALTLYKFSNLVLVRSRNPPSMSRETPFMMGLYFIPSRALPGSKHTTSNLRVLHPISAWLGLNPYRNEDMTDKCPDAKPDCPYKAATAHLSCTRTNSMPQDQNLLSLLSLSCNTMSRLKAPNTITGVIHQQSKRKGYQPKRK